MTITFTPEQEQWLLAQVSAGDFSSVEDAVHQLIDERMTSQAIGDMAWAAPLAQDGLLAFESGDTISHQEHVARNQARLADMTR